MILGDNLMAKFIWSEGKWQCNRCGSYDTEVKPWKVPHVPDCDRRLICNQCGNTEMLNDQIEEYLKGKI